MQYLGGKSRISRRISEVIQYEISRREITNCEINRGEDNRTCVRGGQCLVSLFCGTCSVESKLASYFDKLILNDKHEYLIAMLKAAQNGYEFPDAISWEEYQYIKDHKAENPALTGFVGFGCSFGGKFFGGYARNKTGTNYAAQSKRSLLKYMENLMRAEFTCLDYRAVELPHGCVVYCDPPYDGTTGYSVGKFNSAEFWEYMREISKDHLVFISEQTAPSDFVKIWSKPFTRTIDVNKNNQIKATEKLFIHEKWR